MTSIKSCLDTWKKWRKMTSKALELIRDSTTDERKLEIIQEMTTQRLLNYIGEQEVPQELSYIVDEISIKRFNRLGSEGMSSTSQEGLSMTFEEADFDAFKADLDAWIETNNPQNDKGWVMYNT